MIKTLVRLLRLILAVVLLGWFVAFPHEGFHQLVASTLGVTGRVAMQWGGYGRFNYDPGQVITPTQDGLIGLAGGVLTGAIFLLLWYLTGHPDVKKNISEVDNSFPFLMFGIAQILYSPFDAWIRNWVHWGNGLGIIVGFLVPLLIYWKPVLKWLEGSEDE